MPKERLVDASPAAVMKLFKDYGFGIDAEADALIHIVHATKADVRTLHMLAHFCALSATQRRRLIDEYNDQPRSTFQVERFRAAVDGILRHVGDYLYRRQAQVKAAGPLRFLGQLDPDSYNPDDSPTERDWAVLTPASTFSL